jgi:5-methylcytosine-specific restriction endonuclease McrA
MTANPRRRNGHRRDQLCARVFRTETHCGICGKIVDKTLPYIDPSTGKPDPWAKTVDEIVPVSLGGDPLDRANTRMAHRDCNIRRGDGTRITTESLKRVRTY